MPECVEIFNEDERLGLVAAFDAAPNKQNEDGLEAFYKNSYGVYNLPESLYYVSELTRYVRQNYPDAKFENTYARCYRKGSILGMHTDRIGLDITLSVCLEKKEDRYWPLYISNKEWVGEWDASIDHTPHVADAVAVNPKSGEGVICEGRKFPHWRETFDCEDDERALYIFYHWSLPANQVVKPHTDTANTRVDVSFSIKEPNAYVLDNFMSAVECTELIEQARTKLSRSTVVDATTGESVEDARRTSSGAFFKKAETALVAEIERRISQRVGIPIANGEGLQILRYTTGQEYCPHYDYFDPAASSVVDHLKNGGQRILTFLVYLNTPVLGGATCFPDVGVEVAARQGRALVFSYDPTPASKSLHGGLPVMSGEKWVITKWFRQQPFVD